MKTIATLGLAWIAAVTFAVAPASAAQPPTAPDKAASAAPAAASKPGKPSKPTKQPAPIDINSASKAQLKTLAGIGDAEADKIVAGRPYNSKADLVTRNLIPAGVYQSNRHKMIALPPNKGKSAH